MDKGYILIYGREAELSKAEAEVVFGKLTDIKWGCVIDKMPDLDKLGGFPKAARLVEVLESTSSPVASLKEKLIQTLRTTIPKAKKANFGISFYGFDVSVREINGLAIDITRKLRNEGFRLRSVPNKNSELSSAQVWHNRLDKTPNAELIVLKSGAKLYLGLTLSVQNFESYARRDREKPIRDARVGMLPPKLARTMLNLASPNKEQLVLDPFCGTGTVLMEAAVDGYKVYGSDLDQKMVDGSSINLKWLLGDGYQRLVSRVELADAQKQIWLKADYCVVSEIYLGPPLFSFPSNERLKTITTEVNDLLAAFLTNLATQIKPGTRLVLAVPIWFASQKADPIRLPLVDELEKYGYNRLVLNSVDSGKLIYRRPDQIVGRQLLLLERNE